MPGTIERLANISVGRACGFACLAIVTMMTGLSPEPALAFKAGGILMLMTCAALLLKAFNAPSRPYKSTEVWIMLPKQDRPSPDVAQALIGGTLQRVYLMFARHAALLSLTLLASSLLLAQSSGPTGRML
jgi:hypothetical protein